MRTLSSGAKFPWAYIEAWEHACAACWAFVVFPEQQVLF